MNKRNSLPMAQENNSKFNVKRPSDVAPNPTDNSGNLHLSQSSQSHEATKLANKYIHNQSYCEVAEKSLSVLVIKKTNELIF